MLAEFVFTMIWELCRLALSGLVEQSRSPKSFRFKCTAWGALLSGIALFVITSTLAQGNMITVTVLSGFASLFAFLVFGIRATIENAKVELEEGEEGEETKRVGRRKSEKPEKQTSY